MEIFATTLFQPFDGWVELRHFLAILITCICGLAIGYERTSRNKQAGIKTHMIVALTSCLMMILSNEAFLDTPQYDTARLVLGLQLVEAFGCLECFAPRSSC